MVACNDKVEVKNEKVIMDGIKNDPITYPTFSEVVDFLQSNNWILVDSFADSDHIGALVFHYNKSNENRFLIRWSSIEDIPHRPNVDFDGTYRTETDPNGAPGDLVDKCDGEKTNCFIRKEGDDIYIDCLDEDLPV